MIDKLVGAVGADRDIYGKPITKGKECGGQPLYDFIWYNDNNNSSLPWSISVIVLLVMGTKRNTNPR